MHLDHLASRRDRRAKPSGVSPRVAGFGAAVLVAELLLTPFAEAQGPAPAVPPTAPPLVAPTAPAAPMAPATSVPTDAAPSAPATTSAPAAAPPYPGVPPLSAPAPGNPAPDLVSPSVDGTPNRSGYTANGRLSFLVGDGFGGSSNFYGLGLGASGGYAIAGKVYLGLGIVRHFGSKGSFTPTPDTPATTAQYSIIYWGADAGYEITAGPVIIRPYLGAGAATPQIDVETSTTSAHGSGDTKLYLAPAVAVLVPLGKTYCIGADGRYVAVTGGGDASALGLFATVGVRL